MTLTATATDRRCESVASPATLDTWPLVAVGGLACSDPRIPTRRDGRAARHFTIKSDRLRRGSASVEDE